MRTMESGAGIYKKHGKNHCETERDGIGQDNLEKDPGWNH